MHDRVARMRTTTAFGRPALVLRKYTDSGGRFEMFSAMAANDGVAVVDQPWILVLCSVRECYELQVSHRSI